MVFQRPNPLPISVYENVVFGLRIHSPASELTRASLDEAVEKALDGSRPVEGPQGPARRPRDVAPARAAAEAVHRPAAAAQARGHPDGRAVLGARRRGHARHRGADVRARRPLHDRDRHPQHGPGPARQRRVHLHAAGRADRAHAAPRTCSSPRATRAPPSTSKAATHRGRRAVRPCRMRATPRFISESAHTPISENHARGAGVSRRFVESAPATCARLNA